MDVRKHCAYVFFLEIHVFRVSLKSLTQLLSSPQAPCEGALSAFTRAVHTVFPTHCPGECSLCTWKKSCVCLCACAQARVYLLWNLPVVTARFTYRSLYHYFKLLFPSVEKRCNHPALHCSSSPPPARRTHLTSCFVSLCFAYPLTTHCGW